MKLLLLTLGFGVLSSSIPVFNMEAYISVVYASNGKTHVLALAAVASLGQNIGKLVWYYASRGAFDVPWIRKRMGEPKRQAQLERWRHQVEGRPVFSGALNFVSAAVGFPPFFVMAMVAGTLRMNVVVFFVTGLLGRTLFFWAWLVGVGLIVH
ncbi:SNARE associated Golgi protein [Nocardioides scoriae]|uniref:SNARE associated Golgi protein n=1 Tax=Nocardioides scoriae TaxID=642780 RepID=A0A1H1LVK7_9ACTN|nr:VTT domain-containing protein [Nocardioides scoriae]SDR78543.1 SNARE associated Golgi protein [Nocardioides scoriae]